jgi:hypothetical protein
MKRAIAFVFFFAPMRILASEDTVAPSTSIRAEVILPAPFAKGTIIAAASLNREENVLHFASLSATIGDLTVEVPKKVLDCFVGPRLGSVELLAGPPSEGKPAYFILTFKYGSFPAEGVYVNSDDRPTGRIAIRDGRVSGFTKIEKVTESTLLHTDYDASTLKEIRKGRSERTQ